MNPTSIGDDREPVGMRHVLTGGEILPSQMPSRSQWNPELRLAAAVMTQAMSDIRMRRTDGRDHLQVAATLRWIKSNDSTWPLSFLRVCELLSLDADWVRKRVNHWMRREGTRGRTGPYRHAA